jgi:hypothetical protein
MTERCVEKPLDQRSHLGYRRGRFDCACKSSQWYTCFRLTLAIKRRIARSVSRTSTSEHSSFAHQARRSCFDEDAVR